MNMNIKTNPFIELGKILNNKNDNKESIINLLNFILQSNDKYDINELFDSDMNLGSVWSSKTVKSQTNLFNVLIFKNNIFDHKLITDMVNYGLKINTSILHPDNSIINDMLFNMNSLNDEQNIYLLNLYLKQNNIEDLKEKCKVNSTLHRAISQNKTLLIDFLINKLGIDFLNIDNKTPIMFVKTMDTFEHLLKYSPNLTLKDVYNNDLSHYLSQISNDDVKKDMLNLFIKNVVNDDTQSTSNANLDRLNEVFINLVINDGTKKEISDFIKKNKLTNIHLLTNKENKTLGQILIEKELFERFDLFKKTDLYNIANDNSSILSKLLTTERYSTASKMNAAEDILLDILDYKEKINLEKTFQYLFDNAFNNYQTNIPMWILKKPKKDLSLALNKEDLFELLNIDNQNYSILNEKIKSLGAGSESENKIDLYFNLYTDNFTKYLSFNDLNFVDSIFIEYDKKYSFDHISFFKQLSFLKYYKKEDKEEFTKSLYKDINIKLNAILDYKINSIYNDFDKNNQIEIVTEEHYKKNVIPLLQELSFFDNKDIIKLIDIDIVNNAIKYCDKNNIEMDKFMSTYTYLHLNNSIKDGNIKSIKNKI